MSNSLINEKIDYHIDITGLGNSGKAIVSDYLNEFKNVVVPRKDFEFNLLRAPGGLMDMHYALVENWTPIRADDSIRRFRKLTKRLGAKINYRSPKETFNAAGFRYNDFFPGFSILTDDFLNEIITFTYKGLWPYVSYHNNTFDLVWKRVLSKFYKEIGRENIFFADGESFTDKLNKYVYGIMSLAIKHGPKIYVTHNSFEPYELDRYFQVMKNSKMIIVSRDPRDVYINIIEGNKLKSGFYKKIDPTFYNICAASNIKNFIDYQKKLLSFEKDFAHPNLLAIKFEDFIKSYELVSEKLKKFLGLSSDNHVDQYKYFDPTISIKNIGIHKKSNFSKEIKLIETELEGHYSFS